MGLYLIFFNWFISLTMTESINVSWLRSIGSAIVRFLFLGYYSIYANPKGKLKLLKIISITSLLQTIVLMYSRFYDEFILKIYG